MSGFDIHRIFRKVSGRIEDIFGGDTHSHTHFGEQCNHHHPDDHSANRYQSYAPQTTGGAKWYVDGCSYFWAVSEAIEREYRVFRAPVLAIDKDINIKHRVPHMQRPGRASTSWIGG
jgi:hypothetical protein